MAKRISICRAHYDDFNEHLGWWAEFSDPKLEVGDEIFFEYDWTKQPSKVNPTVTVKPEQDGIHAKVTAVKTQDSRAYGWWIIEFDVI
jgi:hypothetical protein